MDLNEVFGKKNAAWRRNLICKILFDSGDTFTPRYTLAALCYEIANGALSGDPYPKFPIKREDFYKSHAARVITADIAAINADKNNFRTIIHNGKGVKMQSRAEAEIWLRSQFKETLGKLNHLKDIARKNGLDGQAIMQSPDVISAYID